MRKPTKNRWVNILWDSCWDLLHSCCAAQNFCTFPTQHFEHREREGERERERATGGGIVERELVLYYYFVASFLYYRWQVFCYFGHNLWCKKWKRSCSCQLPTTKEVADRAKTFRGARRALGSGAMLPFHTKFV